MAKMNQMYMNIMYGVFGLIVILIIILALKKSSHMESFSNNNELAYACRNNDGWKQGIKDEKGDRNYFCDEDDSFYYTPAEGGFCPANFKQICITPQGQADLKEARDRRNEDKKKNDENGDGN